MLNTAAALFQKHMDENDLQLNSLIEKIQLIDFAVN